MEFLCERGADVNRGQRSSSLHYAACFGRPAVVKVFYFKSVVIFIFVFILLLFIIVIIIIIIIIIILRFLDSFRIQIFDTITTLKHLVLSRANSRSSLAFN